MWALRLTAGPIVKLIMAYRCKREKGPDTPTIVISNHNTNLDPALVTLGFFGYLYFVASEHAFRKGFRSKLLTFVFNPIPINKAQGDSFALKEMIRRLKGGYNICLFAEGNRSFNGVTWPIALATAKLVKISGAALVTYRLEGAYFTSPRWGKKMRRGKTTGRVTGRYTPEEIKSMTAEDVLGAIERGIYEDAYQRQGETPVRYRGKDLAEHIETVLYMCPECKKIGTIHSKGNRFSCSCGFNGVYAETGFLEGENLPFSTITEWDKWQKEQLELAVNNAGDEVICGDDNQRLFMVHAASENSFVGEGPMLISRREFHCAGSIFPLQQIKQFAIVGKMTLLFALKDGTQYEVLSVFPRSALKYLEILNILRTDNGLFSG